MKLKLTILFVIVGVGLYLIKKSEPIRREAVVEVKETVAPVTNEVTTSGRINSESIQAAPVKSEPEKKVKLVEAAPKLDSIRDAIKENPHVTPPSVVEFAASLGERMKDAIESEDAAKDLYPELQNCAQDLPKGSFAFTPRAMCYSDAEQLSKQYPSLQGEFEKLKEGLDPELKQKFSKLSELTNHQ